MSRRDKIKTARYAIGTAALGVFVWQAGWIAAGALFIMMWANNAIEHDDLEFNAREYYRKERNYQDLLRLVNRQEEK